MTTADELGEALKRLIEERIAALEFRTTQHDHAHDIAARLRDAPEKMISARLAEIEALIEDHGVSIHGLSEDVDALRVHLSSKPDDFGGVTSTGAPKTMTRWVIVSGGCVLSAGAGLISRARNVPAFFRTRCDAMVVRDLLFEGWADESTRVEEVEVIERDGRLIEARYA